MTCPALTLRFVPQRCIASALAALSNISLDSELAWKVARSGSYPLNEPAYRRASPDAKLWGSRQLHIPRLVMLLLSGTNKAKHRGAGLVRNLLLAEDTRQRLVQVLFGPMWMPLYFRPLSSLTSSSQPETTRLVTVIVFILSTNCSTAADDWVFVAERARALEGTAAAEARHRGRRRCALFHADRAAVCALSHDPITAISAQHLVA
eukprot:1176900-Rhodomonas_salina.3